MLNPGTNRPELPDSQTAQRGSLAEMGLFEHLGELRRRLIISVIGIFIASCMAFLFSEDLFRLFSIPYFEAFAGSQLIGTGPAEAFMLRIKVSFFGGLVLAVPIVFYQIWLFIVPGLYEQERKMVLPFVCSTSVLFLSGIWFCYEIIFPFALNFFADQYQSAGITPAIRMSEHMTLMIQTMLAFGLVFETPVLAYLLGRFGIINYGMMVRGSRYAIVIIFVLSALLTPPDVLTQVLMAVPLMGLYGLSILIVKWSQRPRNDTKK